MPEICARWVLACLKYSFTLYGLHFKFKSVLQPTIFVWLSVPHVEWKWQGRRVEGFSFKFTQRILWNGKFYNWTNFIKFSYYIGQIVPTAQVHLVETNSTKRRCQSFRLLALGKSNKTILVSQIIFVSGPSYFILFIFPYNSTRTHSRR